MSRTTQLTIRGFDAALERHIRTVARTQRISLNQAVLRVLRQGAGLEPGAENPRVIGAALDDLIGTWTAEEAREFDHAVHDFEHIDDELWR
jgi:hypothetical protein